MFNSVGVLGTSAFSVDGGKTWTVNSNGNFSTFDVQGITSVPEPSTLGLFGAGILGIAETMRRKSAVLLRGWRGNGPC
jgi:hypothetical protein